MHRFCFIFSISLAIFGFSACGTAQPATVPASAPAAQATAPSKPAPLVTWDKKTQDIGTVKRGDTKTLFFEFTNTSKEDIQIDIVDACECTKIDFPRGVVKPGEKGRLNVRFDSKDKEAAETIGINVVFKNIGPDGFPRIEVVEYKFDIAK